MWTKIWESKWFYIVLSILMAFILRTYVIGEVNPEKSDTIRDVPISFSGTEILAGRSLIISESDTQTLDMKIQAPIDTFARLNRETVQLTVLSSEFSKITKPGTYHLRVEIGYSPSVPNPNSIVVVNAEDLYVDIKVSKLEDKTIPVRGEFIGSVAENYQVGEFIITPSNISISGQSELVNRVAYAKVVLTQKDLNETYIGDLAFVYVGSDGQELTDLNVTPNVDTVHVVYPIVQTKRVPVVVDLIPGGGATEEDAVVNFGTDKEPLYEFYLDVSGSEEDLQSLNEIVLGEVDLSQVVPREEFTFPVQLGEEFTNESGINEITVKVSVSGLATREFDVDNIQLINEPEGYKAELVSQSRQVMVRGPQEAVDAVFQAQLRIVVDLSAAQLAAGRQTVPAKVYLDGASSVGVVADYTVVVILTQEE